MTDKPNTNDIALDLIDFHIKHYEKLGHRETVAKFKELKEDIENAIVFKKE